MDGIMKLADDLYLVNGKVIEGLDHGMFESPEGQAGLKKLGNLGGRYSPASHGALTVFGVGLNNDPGSKAAYTMASQRHFSSLPDDVKEILRKELPDHASEF